MPISLLVLDNLMDPALLCPKLHALVSLSHPFSLPPSLSFNQPYTIYSSLSLSAFHPTLSHPSLPSCLPSTSIAFFPLYLLLNPYPVPPFLPPFLTRTLPSPIITSLPPLSATLLSARSPPLPKKLQKRVRKIEGGFRRRIRWKGERENTYLLLR